MELVPSAFILLDDERSMVFKLAAELFRRDFFTMHWVTARTKPRQLGEEIAGGLSLLGGRFPRRKNPVIPVCIVACDGLTDTCALALQSLSFIARHLDLRRTPFRADVFTSMPEHQPDAKEWFSVLEETENRRPACDVAFYLLSRKIGAVRISDQVIPEVVRRFISVFALTGPSRSESNLSFTNFRSRAGVRVYLAGLEAYSVPDLQETAEQIIDQTIWEQLLPEFSANVRLRSEQYLAINGSRMSRTAGPRPGMRVREKLFYNESLPSILVEAGLHAIGLEELPDYLDTLRSQYGPVEADAILDLLVDLKRAITEANEPPKSRQAKPLPCEEYYDPKTDPAVLNFAAEAVRELFELYPLPVFPYFIDHREAALTRQLTALRKKATDSLISFVREQFGGVAFAKHNDWLTPDYSPASQTQQIGARLGAEILGGTAETFVHVSPELSNDLRDELTAVPCSIHFSFVLPIARKQN